MTVDQAIKVLEEIKKEAGGEIEFVVTTLVDGNFITEYGRDIELIGLIKEDDTEEEVVSVINFSFDELLSD